MTKAYKGSDFEREICKRLSRWWTGGERDDIFWRSSQSGGRATERAKKGMSTFGSYGDIAAVDPIGAPLLKVFTIELKRGSSYSCPGDLIDFKRENHRHPWVQCLLQSMRSAEQAGSQSWMLICRRDHRMPVVYLRAAFWNFLCPSPCVLTKSPELLFGLSLVVRDGSGKVLETVGIRGMSLDLFLAKVPPTKIIELSRHNHEEK